MKKEFNTIRTLDPESREIPRAISEYVRTHFRNDFLTTIRPFAQPKGKKQFMVDVNHESSLYHFTFDSSGLLLHSSAETLHELYVSEAEFA